MADEVYLTPKQTACYLKISSSTLAKRRLYGGGPRFSRFGRAIRYAKTDLDAFMRLNIASSTSDGGKQS